MRVDILCTRCDDGYIIPYYLLGIYLYDIPSIESQDSFMFAKTFYTLGSQWI